MNYLNYFDQLITDDPLYRFPFKNNELIIEENENKENELKKIIFIGCSEIVGFRTLAHKQKFLKSHYGSGTNADGIVIAKINSRCYALTIEMKTTLTFDDYNDAKRQINVTNANISYLRKLIQNFRDYREDITEYNIIFARNRMDKSPTNFRKELQIEFDISYFENNNRFPIIYCHQDE